MEVGTVLRTQKDGSRKEVSCPIALVKYNQYMGGVDHFSRKVFKHILVSFFISKRMKEFVTETSNKK